MKVKYFTCFNAPFFSFILNGARRTARIHTHYSKQTDHDHLLDSPMHMGRSESFLEITLWLVAFHLLKKNVCIAIRVATVFFSVGYILFLNINQFDFFEWFQGKRCPSMHKEAYYKANMWRPRIP